MSPQKISLGITGGIGSGKSYVCHLLEMHGIPVFYCDPEARIEMQTNPEIWKDLSELVGKGIFSDDHQLNKPLMRDFMMRSPQNVSQINSVIHPRVLQRLLRWIEAQPSRIVAVECALLFESGFDKYVSHRVFVSASESVRLHRVMTRDSIDEQTARKWMSWQLSEVEKQRLSDFVIVNDGQHDLEPQIDLLLNFKK